MWRSGTARQRHPQPSPWAAGQRAGSQEPRSQSGGWGVRRLPRPESLGAAAHTAPAAAAAVTSWGTWWQQITGMTSWGGGQYLSSGCPQPAPCPTAVRSRVPTCFPSAGDKVASMGTGQRVAPRPCPLSLGRGRARLRPGRSPAGAAPSRWVHLLLSPQVRVLCGDPQLARRQRLRAELPAGGGRLAAGGGLGGPRSGGGSAGLAPALASAGGAGGAGGEETGLD